MKVDFKINYNAIGALSAFLNSINPYMICLAPQRKMAYFSSCT